MYVKYHQQSFGKAGGVYKKVWRRKVKDKFASRPVPRRAFLFSETQPIEKPKVRKQNSNGTLKLLYIVGRDPSTFAVKFAFPPASWILLYDGDDFTCLEAQFIVTGAGVVIQSLALRD